jgi:small subunit ribosomal protein S18
VTYYLRARFLFFSWQNLKLLEYFVTDSGSIKPAKQTGLCTKCQRRMAKTVKRARQMAMIPIVEGWSTQDFTENIEDLSRGGRHDRTI